MLYDIYQYLEQGGVLMIPIIASSVIALTFFMERVLFLQKNNINPKKLTDDLYDLLKKDKISEALTVVKHNNKPILSKLMDPILNNWERDKPFLKELAQERGKKEVVNMEKFIGLISVIATIAPLMGLLGTVSGMISVFREFIYSQNDPSFMSDGISKALLTTAAGMVVAIPAILMSKYLYSRVDILRVDLEQNLFELIELKDYKEIKDGSEK